MPHPSIPTTQRTHACGVDDDAWHQAACLFPFLFWMVVILIKQNMVNFQGRRSYERKRHPELSAECVHGRLIVQSVIASDGSSVVLYLFTTLDLKVDQLVQLYGMRWQVETDLRTLKRTLELQILRSKSVNMIAKELVLSITGYNLVRAVMNAAAQKYRLDPRRLSFSRSQDVIIGALPALAAETSPVKLQARLRRMLKRVASCKLPDRKTRIATPRMVWGHGCKFAKHRVHKNT